MAGGQVFPTIFFINRNDVQETVLVKVFEIPADIIVWRADDINVYTEPVEVVFQDQKECATSFEDYRGPVFHQGLQQGESADYFLQQLFVIVFEFL